MRATFALAVLLASCTRGLELPAPAGPGSISGRLVVAVPGSAVSAPAAGASIQLLQTNVSATSSDDGRFVLTPVTAKTGQLLIRFEPQPGGGFGRQRIVSLEELGAGPGRDVAAGDLLIRENATLRGRVVRGDHATDTGGHKGTTVFLPEGPFTTQTGDDGSWILASVPEGTVSVAFFRDGYAPAAIDAIAVRAGESVTFRDVVLTPAPAQAPAVPVDGVVHFSPAIADASSASVRAVSFAATLQLPVDKDGAFSASLPPGLYEMEYAYPGYSSASVPNVLVAPGSAAVRLPEVTLSPGQPPPPPDAGTPPPPPPPTAAISSPGVGATGARFTLDASTSSGTPGHLLTFSWRQLSGQLVALEKNDSADAVKSSFVAPALAQSLGFSLTVTDVVTGLTASAGTTVQLFDAPTAAISSPALGRAGGAFTLDASASQGPHALSFAWQQTAGEPVALANAATSRPSFVAPRTAQTLSFTLTVTDTVTQLSASASTSIAFFDPPVATASAQASAQTGATVTLDASLSTAPHAATFSWRQSAGDSVVLSANDSPSADVVTFTAPQRPQHLEFGLTVTDTTTSLTATATVALDVVVLPHAAIAAIAPVRAGATVLLDGSASTVAPGSALSFHWAAAPGVTFSANDGVSAVTTSFVAPSAAGAVTVTLTVTDLLSSAQAQAQAVVVVAVAPVAVIQPSTLTVRSGMTFSLDGSQSGPQPLAYAWSVLSGTPSSFTGATTAKPTFTAGSTPFSVQLVVSSPQLSSDPAILQVQISSSAVVPPTLTMPASSTANLSQTVSLTATATHPDPAATFAFTWTQTAGGTVAVSHSDAGGSSTATFVAPSSPDVLTVGVTVTATDGTGAQSQASGSVSVVVEDLNPPHVVATDPPFSGAPGSFLYAKVTFDKPLDPASVTSGNIFIQGVTSDLSYDAPSRTVTILPRSPLAPATQYTLEIGAVTDLSTPANVHAPETLTFITRQPQWRTWMSQVTTIHPTPGIAVLPSETVIGAKRAGTQNACNAIATATWFMSPGSRLELVDAGTCLSQANFDYPARRVIAVGTQLYAQLSDTNGNTSNPMPMRRLGGVWQNMTAAGNGTTYFTDGVTLYGIAGSGSADTLLSYDPAANNWPSSVSLPQTGSMQAWAPGGAAFGTRLLVATSNLVNSCYFIRALNKPAGSSTFSVEGGQNSTCGTNNMLVVGNAYVNARAVFAGNGVAVVTMGNSQSNASGIFTAYEDSSDPTGWHLFSQLSTAYGAYDVAARGDTVYAAFVKAGQLFVSRMDLGGAPPYAWTPVQGPLGTAWNENLGGTASCTADFPELAFASDGLYVTWQESCAAGEYRVVLRKYSGTPLPSSPGLDAATALGSCKEIHDANPSAPDGSYWIAVGAAKMPVYCDMTTNGGGWTLAAGIVNTGGHIAAGAVSFGGLLATSAIGKLSDATINALRCGSGANTACTGGTDPAYRLTCTQGGLTKTGFFPGSCVFNSTTTASGACLSAAYTYPPASYETVQSTQAGVTGVADGDATPSNRLIYAQTAQTGCNAGAGWGGSGTLWVR